LLEMLRGSDVDAEIAVDAVPALPGARHLLGRGIESTMAPANRAGGASLMRPASTEGPAGLLFDPQTSGGLLIGIAADKAPGLIDILHREGAPQAAIVGRVLPRAGTAPLLSLMT
jgi:selenide,water dikinase